MKKLVVIVVLMAVLLATVAGAETKVTNIPMFRAYLPLHENDKTSFRIERYILMITGNLEDVADYNTTIFFQPWVPVVHANVYVESMYISLKKLPKIGALPMNGKIWIGQGRNMNFGIMPSGGNRKTSEYGLVSDMFTHDRIQGIQLNFSDKMFHAGLSLHNGYRLGTRSFGSVKFIADRGIDLVNSAAGDIDKGKEVCARVGVKPIKGLDMAISGSFAKLYDDGKAYDEDADGDGVPDKNDDLVLLKGILGEPTENTNKIRLGLDSTYTPAIKGDIVPTILRVEAYQGMSGDLSHTAIQALGGLKIKPINCDIYVRYGMTMLDLEDSQRSAANTLTWDLSQIGASAVFGLGKGLSIRVEYEKNLEKVPGDGESVDNDKLFIETCGIF